MGIGEKFTEHGNGEMSKLDGELGKSNYIWTGV